MQQPQTAPDGAPRVSEVCGIDLSTTATFDAGPPHAAYDVLRAQAPVAWQDETLSAVASSSQTGLPRPFSPGFWAVTSHGLIEEMSRNPAQYSSWLGGTQIFSADELSLAGLRLMMLNMDPPNQVRLRKIVSPSFGTQSIAALREFVLEQAKKIASEMDRNETVDLVDAVSRKLTTRVLAHILGMPQSDAHLIARWSDALIGFEDAEQAGDLETTIAMHMELNDYAKAVLADRRERPREGDLVSTVANAEVDGVHLSPDEFSFFWTLLIIAGNETTRNSLSGSVLALDRHGLWQQLAADPAQLAGSTIEELFRHVSPVMQFRRTATSDVVLGTQRIRAGDKVVMYYSAANRDPAVFAEPHVLKPLRDPNPHSAFGIRSAFCLGTRVAC